MRQRAIAASGPAAPASQRDQPRQRIVPRRKARIRQGDELGATIAAGRAHQDEAFRFQSFNRVRNSAARDLQRFRESRGCPFAA